MQKRRVNIQVRDGIDPAIAVQRVATVMAGGRVSDEGRDYCWVSTFSDGIVVCVLRVYGRVNSDSFVVYKEEKHESEEASSKT